MYHYTVLRVVIIEGLLSLPVTSGLLQLAGDIERRSRQIFYLERNCEQRSTRMHTQRLKFVTCIQSLIADVNCSRLSDALC